MKVITFSNIGEISRAKIACIITSAIVESRNPVSEIFMNPKDYENLEKHSEIKNIKILDTLISIDSGLKVGHVSTQRS